MYQELAPTAPLIAATAPMARGVATAPETISEMYSVEFLGCVPVAVNTVAVDSERVMIQSEGICCCFACRTGGVTKAVSWIKDITSIQVASRHSSWLIALQWCFFVWFVTIVPPFFVYNGYTTYSGCHQYNDDHYICGYIVNPLTTGIVSAICGVVLIVYLLTYCTVRYAYVSLGGLDQPIVRDLPIPAESVMGLVSTLQRRRDIFPPRALLPV